MDTAVLCPSCGYSLRGLPDGDCPECGRPFLAAILTKDLLDHAVARAAFLRACLYLLGALAALVLSFTSGEPIGVLLAFVAALACIASIRSASVAALSPKSTYGVISFAPILGSVFLGLIILGRLLISLLWVLLYS